MAKKILYLFFGLFFLFDIGCKKDSTQTSTEDKIIGTWNIESFYVNGNDSTQAVKDSCYASVRFFQEQYEPYGLYLVNQSTNTTGHCYFYGRWSTYGDFFVVKWEGPPDINIGPYYLDSLLAWRIISIDDKFWNLSINYDSSFYQLKYKKIN